MDFRFHGFDLKRAMDLLKRLRSDDDVDAERVVEDQKGTPEQNATAVTAAISVMEPDHGKRSSQIFTFPLAFDPSHQLTAPICGFLLLTNSLPSSVH